LHLTMSDRSSADLYNLYNPPIATTMPALPEMAQLGIKL
jgi:hypothetical protein